MTSQVLTDNISAAFDIIKELHSIKNILSFTLKCTNHISYVMAGREMRHVLQLIFKYFDEDTIANAELTSKDWRAAISYGNSHKLWNNLLHQKACLRITNEFLNLFK